jgi:hypothetical protein
MAGWALGTAILIEAVENDPSPDEALSRLFERANAILDHFGREGETEMIGVARASIQGSFEWARQVRERGE